MIQEVDLSKWSFGDGAFQSEGTPVLFKFGNGTTKFWIRAMDSIMIARLASKGVDMDGFLRSFDADSKSQTKEEEEQTKEELNAAIVENSAQHVTIVKELVAKFEPFELPNGSMVECTPENIEALGGTFLVVSAVLMQSALVAGSFEKNLESSQPGTETASKLKNAKTKSKSGSKPKVS